MPPITNHRKKGWEMNEDNRIAIGKIAKPVGLKGEVKVLPWTDFPERFAKLSRVFVRK